MRNWVQHCKCHSFCSRVSVYVHTRVFCVVPNVQNVEFKAISILSVLPICTVSG